MVGTPCRSLAYIVEQPLDDLRASSSSDGRRAIVGLCDSRRAACPAGMRPARAAPFFPIAERSAKASRSIRGD